MEFDYDGKSSDSTGKQSVNLTELTEHAWQIFEFAFLSLCRMKSKPFFMDFDRPADPTAEELAELMKLAWLMKMSQ